MLPSPPPPKTEPDTWSVTWVNLASGVERSWPHAGPGRFCAVFDWTRTYVPFGGIFESLVPLCAHYSHDANPVSGVELFRKSWWTKRYTALVDGQWTKMDKRIPESIITSYFRMNSIGTYQLGSNKSEKPSNLVGYNTSWWGNWSTNCIGSVF